MKKVLFYSLLLLLGWNKFLFAYTDWAPFYPGGGGWLRDVTCHPTDSNIVWVMVVITGLFKSTDGGYTFKQKTAPMQLEIMTMNDFPNGYRQFAIDPKDPNICYFAAWGRPGLSLNPKNGIWKSTDGGESWFFCDTPESKKLGRASIIVDYNGVLYCARNLNPDYPTENKEFYVSTDGGATFIKKSDMPVPAPLFKPTNDEGDAMHIAVSKNNRVFVANTAQNGLFYTVDQGQTWMTVSAFSALKLASVACSPVDGNLIMAITTNNRIWRSTDGGSTFTQNSKTISGNWFDPLRRGGIAINGKGTVIAWGADRAISYDQGQTFSSITSPYLKGDFIYYSTVEGQCTDLAASPVSSRWYAVNSMTTWQNLDNGAGPWTARCIGVKGLCVYTRPIFDITDPNRVFFGCADLGQVYTTDLGLTWYCNEPDWADIAGIAQSPATPDIFYKMYATHGVPSGFYKSTNKGMNWTKVSDFTVQHRALGTLIVDSINPDELYYSDDPNNGVFKSADGGINFSRIGTSSDTLGLCHLNRSKGGNIYGTGNLWDAPLLAYVNDTWHTIVADGVSGYAVRPDNESIIFAAVGTHDYHWSEEGVTSPGKLKKTTDGGANWNEIKDAQGNSFDPWALYIDPVQPDVMLMNTIQHYESNGTLSGVMRSLDGGQTWHSIHHSHSNNNMWGMVYGGVPGRVYTWYMTADKIENLYTPGYEGVSIREYNGPREIPIRLSVSSYPNPFSMGMTVFYSIGELSGKSEQAVNVAIYDILGNEIKTLVSGNQAPGKYQTHWDGVNNTGKECAGAVYFCTVETGKESVTQKLLRR